MAEYKICPFCKQKILKNSIECLFCKRVLIEKLEHSTYQSQDDATQKEEKVSQQEIGQKKHNVIGYILEKLRGLKFFTIGLGIKMSLFFAKFNNWKVILIIVATTIFIIGIYKSENKKINPNFAVAKISPKIPENKPVPQYDNVRKDYFSLPNGTMINSNPYYLDGLGELKINNGTDRDAVFKLVNTDIGKSIFTVYIKSKNIYRIKKICDGTYKLFFNIGQNWDKTSKRFLVNNSYSKFRELCNFETHEQTYYDKIETKYSAFEITLHSVIGGSAKTDNIDPKEFENY